MIRARRLAVGALALSLLSALSACGQGSSEKTATETFGCYVGSCVVEGEGPDDGLDAGDAGADATDRADGD